MSRFWLMLANTSLLVGGVLSIVLMLGRVPLISELISDPDFAKRCLTVHVNLTLSCWFLGFLAGLGNLFTKTRPPKIIVYLSILSICTFTVGGFISSSSPILSNYFPVIHEPMFLIGISVFLFMVALSILHSGVLWRSNLNSLTDELNDPSPHLFAKLSSWIFIFSLIVLGASAYTLTQMPRDQAYYEKVFWGFGHLLQMANVATLVCCWSLLYSFMTQSPLFTNWSRWVIMSFIALPSIACFLIFLFQGATSPYYNLSFALLMRWGTWPGPLIAIIIFFYRTIFQPAKNSYSPIIFLSTSLSMLLLCLGFSLGSQISTSSTLIPAHYHATIGSLTLVMMIVSYKLFARFGIVSDDIFKDPWAIRVFLFYGVGQFTFAVGFAIAGLHGLGRKIFGSEQIISEVGQNVGLSIMGVGGALALSGGALYFIFLFKYLRPWSRA